MSVISGYEPVVPLKFFEELCAIPHGSKNMKAISDYCVKFAQERNLEVIQDEFYNVIITKEATPGYEEEVGIIIQGHLDMVCEKVSDSDFDFEKDGLVLETDGEWLWAKDTTLGGDDGVAIAIALALLDATNIPHPKLEAIFTVDEEIGLIGATNIDLSTITGKKLINIDAEDDSQIITSCAGGSFLEGQIPMGYEEKEGVEYLLQVKGMLGGHSGAEIHKGRGNSTVLMGRLLMTLDKLVDVSDVHGGSADNVIPSHTSAIVVVDADDEKAMLDLVNVVEAELQSEYMLADPEIKVVCTRKEVGSKRVLVSASKLTLLNTLMNLPSGIQAMSMSIPGLVETSTNMGVCYMEEDMLIIKFNIRSSKESARKYLTNRTMLMIEAMGGKAILHGEYPGWEYKIDSELRKTVVEKYVEQFGKEPEIAAIHAGLECGLFGEKIEDLDCVSIGPNLFDIHSYNERLELASFNRIWKLVVGTVGNKNN